MKLPETLPLKTVRSVLSLISSFPRCLFVCVLQSLCCVLCCVRLLRTTVFELLSKEPDAVAMEEVRSGVKVEDVGEDENFVAPGDAGDDAEIVVEGGGGWIRFKHIQGVHVEEDVGEADEVRKDTGGTDEGIVVVGGEAQDDYGAVRCPFEDVVHLLMPSFLILFRPNARGSLCAENESTVGQTVDKCPSRQIIWFEKLVEVTIALSGFITHVFPNTFRQFIPPEILASGDSEFMSKFGIGERITQALTGEDIIQTLEPKNSSRCVFAPIIQRHFYGESFIIRSSFPAQRRHVLLMGSTVKNLVSSSSSWWSHHGDQPTDGGDNEKDPSHL